MTTMILNYSLKISRFFIFLASILPAIVHSDISPHKEPKTPTPCFVVKYQLTDFGEANLEPVELTKLELVYSLAPQINNLGQVAYNTAQGAFIRDPNHGEYALQFNGPRVFTHAINNKGELLVSINRGENQIEWMLWPSRSHCGLGREEPDLNKRKLHIANIDNLNSPIFLCSLNDSSMAAGYREDNQKLIPLGWTPGCGLLPLGNCSGFNLFGFSRGLNNQGSVVGYFQDANDSPPFVWNPCRGLLVLRNYRQLADCQGWIDLKDLVITGDDVVYGTYIVKFVSKKKGNNDDLGVYFLYRWDPIRDDFERFNTRNFRVAAVNSSHTLVGKQGDEAAMFKRGEEPVELKKLVPNDMEGWELLEATDINDQEQIVGYGRKAGKIHIFLIEPLR